MMSYSFEDIKPVINIVSIILNTSDLVKSGVKPNIRNLLLPSLITTYGVQVIVKREGVTAWDFGVYAVGFVLSLYLHSSSYLLYLLKELPNLSRVQGSMQLLTSPKCMVELGDAVVQSVIGAVLRRIALRKRMRMRTAEILKMLFYPLAMVVIHELHLSPFCAVFAVYFFPLATRLQKYLTQRSRTAAKKEKRRQPLLNTAFDKLPRRRASVARILEKQQKDE